jgi:hypothetical protein
MTCGMKRASPRARQVRSLPLKMDRVGSASPATRSTRPPPNQIDALQRTIDGFDKSLKPQG